MTRAGSPTRLTTGLILLVSFVALLSTAPTVLATGWGPSLGAASGFAALAGGAVTCTTSTVAGNVGYGTAFTNTSCTVTGNVSPGAAAYADFFSAYDWLRDNTTCDQTLTGTLAGVTLPPGVYCFTAAATLSGTLTLDGPADGVTDRFEIGLDVEA